MASKGAQGRPPSGRLFQRLWSAGLSLVLMGPFLGVPLAAQSEAPGEGESDLNTYCPVWPDRLAKAAYTTKYRGRTVRLCCSTCLRLFERNPEKYLKNVPQLADLAEGKTSGFSKLTSPLRDTDQIWLYSVLGVLLVFLLIVNSWRRRGSEAQRPRYELILFLLVALGAGVGMGRKILNLQAEVADLRYQTWLDQLEKVMHNNTYVDYGDPPIPERPPVPPRLASVFYRGNDERSPDLFNGGNYLTAYLRLSLHGGDGRPLLNGDEVGEEWLQVRFEIERAPHTPEEFWTEDVMGVIFLTRQTDRFLGLERPVEDRVDLVELDARRRWEALFPIGRARGFGEERLEGVIYVADEWLQYGRLVGATLHYALQYEISLEDGRIVATSDLFMGSLFRPRKSPVWKVPSREWLSHEPIPELPEPGVKDPELLGLTDYYEESGLPLK